MPKKKDQRHKEFHTAMKIVDSLSIDDLTTIVNEWDIEVFNTDDKVVNPILKELARKLEHLYEFFPWSIRHAKGKRAIVNLATYRLAKLYIEGMTAKKELTRDD